MGYFGHGRRGVGAAQVFRVWGPSGLGFLVRGGFAGHLKHDRRLWFGVEGSALSLQGLWLVDLSAAGRVWGLRRSFGFGVPYKGTSLMRNIPPLGTYSSTCLGLYGGPRGGGGFL